MIDVTKLGEDETNELLSLKLFKCTIYQQLPDIDCYVLAKDHTEIYENIGSLVEDIHKSEYYYNIPEYDFFDEPVDIDEKTQCYRLSTSDDATKYMPYLLGENSKYDGKFTISEFVDLKNEIMKLKRGDRGIIEEGQMSIDELMEPTDA